MSYLCIPIPIVYTTKGTLISAVFNGNCTKCHNIYYYSYYFTKDGKQHYYPPDHNNFPYFQSTSQTIFEIYLLEQLTVQLTFSACSFQSQCEVYNSLHGQSDQIRLEKFVSNFRRSNLKECDEGLDWMLNVTRLEDGWFLHQLVSVYQDLGVLDTHNFAIFTSGNRRDIEEFCQKAMLIITTSPPKWVQHYCNTPGCKEGAVAIDGNEKLTRPHS